MSQLQPGGIYPVWSSVAACGYPTPTSLDPNGMASGGTAGVPDGTVLQNVATCSCLPSGRLMGRFGRLAVVTSNTTLSGLYVPGRVYFPGPNINVTIQNSEHLNRRRLGVRLWGRRERQPPAP